MSSQTKFLKLLIILMICQYAYVTYPDSIDEEKCLCNTTKVLSNCEHNCIEVALNNLKQWKKRRRFWGTIVVMSESVREKRSSSLGQDKNELVKLSPSKGSLSLVGRFKEQWPVKLWCKYGFSDDYIILINPHWLKFSPPHNAVNYSLGGLYILLMIVGCTGNGLVLIMYLKCRTLRTPGNILVANLALSDFFMLAKTPVFIFNSFNLGPALGKTGCVIYGFLGGLTGCTSIATLAAIALDRYWAIARPLEGLRALTAIRARMLAVGAWLYAALFASVPALDIGYGRYVPEGYLTSCSFDYLTDELRPRYFIFVFFCAAWVAPICIISFCYANILRVVVFQRNASMSKNDHRLSSRHVKEQIKKKAELKLAILVMGVISLFFVSWTPYAIVALLGIFGRKDLITPTTSMIPALFCKTAACINPFVYIITHPKFKKELRNLLCQDKSRRYGGTLKRYGSETTTNYHRPSKDSSNIDVEILSMKDIPFHARGENKKEYSMGTVSGQVAEREDSLGNISMKSLEEDVVSPPSWFTKPQFSRKKSFHRRSTRSAISYDTDP